MHFKGQAVNNKWQMAFILKKIYLDMTDEIALLTALYWVQNFQSYNKHLFFLARHIGLITKKVPICDLTLQLDNIWQHQFIERFRKLVIENSEWFIGPMLYTIFGII